MESTNVFASEPFVSPLVLPINCLQYCGEQSGTDKFFLGPFNVRETMRIVWLLADAEFSIRASGHCDFFDCDENGLFEISDGLPPTRSAVWELSGGGNIRESSILPQPYRRVGSINEFHVNISASSDICGSVHFNVSQPRYAENYGASIPFLERQFVFPSSAISSISDNNIYIGYSLTETLPLSNYENTLLSTAKVSFFGKEKTLFIHADAGALGGTFRGSATSIIEISSPQFFTIT